LPPNTTSLLQPFDQGIIKTSKAYYVRNTFEQVIAKTIGNDAISLTEFLEYYNIRHAIENIQQVWQLITANNIRGVWNRILSHCANSSDFEEETVIEETTNIERELGFDGLESDDVRKLLKSHSED
jgi:hypothetical protein